MTVVRSNKIRVYPTPEQESILRQRMGASRFVWNWCLSKWMEEYRAGNKPTPNSIAKQFRLSRPDWFLDMDSGIIDRVTNNLGYAFQAFYKKNAKYPKFHKKGPSDSYLIKAAIVKVSDTHIKVPRLSPIKLSRPLFRVGKVVGNIALSAKAGRWYAAIPVELETNPITSESQATVGIDLGIRTFATLSTGEKILSPRPLFTSQRRLAIRQRRLSRCEKGSNNRAKAKQRFARAHAQVSNKRRGFLQGLSTRIAGEFGAASLEDLDVKEMQRDRIFSRFIVDTGFYEFRRQLEYKMAGRVFIADRWFPSSKLCHCCGHVYEALGSKKSWRCAACGTTHDRDINAAINLRVRAIRSEFTPASSQEDMTSARTARQSRKRHSQVTQQVCA